MISTRERNIEYARESLNFWWAWQFVSDNKQYLLSVKFPSPSYYIVFGLIFNFIIEDKFVFILYYHYISLCAIINLKFKFIVQLWERLMYCILKLQAGNL